MKIWKRNAVVSVIVLFVCVALYLSWSYGRVPDDEQDVFDPNGGLKPSGQVSPNPNEISSGDADPNSPALEDDRFNEARVARMKARDAARAILNDAISNADATEEIRQNAAAEIEKLAQDAMTEAVMENVIKAKGFGECVVFISNGGIRIVVAEPEGGMTAADAAKIKDVVLTESALTVDDITLVPVSV